MKVVRLSGSDWRKNDRLVEIKNRGKGLEGKFLKAVEEIIENVQRFGDEAVFGFAKKFDGFDATADNIWVSDSEVKEAFKALDPELIKAIETSVSRVRQFHEKQIENSYFSCERGVFLGQRVIPLEKVAVYVPGGKASYPSSVIMNAVPAKVAGVKEVIALTPAKSDGKVNPATLVAAKLSGVDRIAKLGGAHAIAAAALGTQSIPKVDKIVGPGNIFVALAKKLLFGTVDIDMVAGPSEILVIADSTAHPAWVAADLLSQAEHDELAGAFLVTDDEKLSEEVLKKVEEFLRELPRADIARKSIERFGTVFLTESLEHSVEVANEIAPEHLELAVKDPFSILSEIKNAGAVFLGHYASEPLGDYILGPNHVLPTGGSAKFFSPLGVYDFLKRISVIYVSEEGFSRLFEDAVKLATAEGLSAHANSLLVRKNHRNL